MKIISVVGARPQFIKLAPLSKQLSKNHNEIIIHTGQHYDARLSKVFFDLLNIPKPHYNLNIGSNTHGAQTGRMLEQIEKLLQRQKPKLVIVFGDTNSTLAGALAATKLHIPVAHIESGMRSFNKKMPEERNRILTDHISDLHFCSTKQSAQWLKDEGIVKNVFVVGDIMIDALANHVKRAEMQSTILKKLKLKPKQYALATIHRAENTDDGERLESILNGLKHSKKDILLPLHPRTKKFIKKHRLTHLLASKNIKHIPPVNYYDMLSLEQHARLIITDSGGMQKEAYFFKVPCVTLRDETEWVETIAHGWNTLVGANSKKIIQKIRSTHKPKKYTSIYGHGTAAKKIVTLIDQWQKKNESRNAR